VRRPLRPLRRRARRAIGGQRQGEDPAQEQVADRVPRRGPRARDPELAAAHATALALVSPESADLLTGDLVTARLFLAVAQRARPQTAAKWIINELPRALGDAPGARDAGSGDDIAHGSQPIAQISAPELGALLAAVDDGSLPTSTAKALLTELVRTGKPFAELRAQVAAAGRRSGGGDRGRDHRKPRQGRAIQGRQDRTAGILRRPGHEVGPGLRRRRGQQGASRPPGLVAPTAGARGRAADPRRRLRARCLGCGGASSRRRAEHCLEVGVSSPAWGGCPQLSPRCHQPHSRVHEAGTAESYRARSGGAVRCVRCADLGRPRHHPSRRWTRLPAMPRRHRRSTPRP